MTLHCTLVGGPGSRLSGRQLELTIEGPDGTLGTLVAERLARAFGTGTVRVDDDDLRTVRLGIPPLVNGAILVDSGAEPVGKRQRRRASAETGAPLLLAVHSGAGAGTLVPLRRGAYTLGRKNSGIVIADAELSRQHARIVVTDTQIFIEDLGSANGTFVDNQRIRRAAISTRSTIRCGNATMSLVFADAMDRDLRAAGGSVLEPITVPGRAEPGSRTTMVVTAALPLAIGVGLAAFTGMWMFLAFSAASSLALLIPAFGGRRQRKDLAAAIRKAVDQDSSRRQASAPPLSSLVLAARWTPAGPAAATGEAGMWLRLGLADQPANVGVGPDGGRMAIPPLKAAPVTIDLEQPRTSFHGSPQLLEGMLRAIIMQLAGYPRCRTTRIIIHGDPEKLPVNARYLPRVTMTASAGACRHELGRGLTAGCHRGVLLLVQPRDEAAGGPSLTGDAVNHGWHVIEFRPADSSSPQMGVGLFERGSFLRQPDGELAFVPDLATGDVFDAFCRKMAGTSPHPGSDGRTVPATCDLEEVLPLTAADTAARWEANRRGDGLEVPLGLAATGMRSLDLQKDGPHLLVAGTTGSGKSELLRSLTLSLALSHSPDRVNFLFVDFKGGSGLGPLTGLVHCVGLLTDLERYALERTLASLRAEIRVREEALASACVPDLAAYRRAPASQRQPLPHLLIIIDEFRMLVDDAPEVLRELMRIAAIGRSLGIHLVMATQRPQGALTADIRANVTSSIALRVQSELESVDVIGSKFAAGISLDAPGRAYIARGTEPAEEFQAATSCPSRPRLGNLDAVAVHLATDYLKSGTGAESGEAPTPAQAAAPLLELIRDVWAARGGAPPRVPVAAPLPPDLPAPSGNDGTETSDPGSAWSVPLGLMDVPAAQRVEPLVWDPAGASHLAFIGSPASGAPEALELTVRRLLLHNQPSHCYILDGTGNLHPAAPHHRVGAYTGLHELRRAVRILERLARELAVRLSRPDEPAVPLIAVISGWGSWMSAFRSGPLAWAEDLVHDLVRDGAGAGITVLTSGDRELVTARFCAALPNRLYFPAGSTGESRVAWPRMLSTPAVKSRAVAFGPIAGGEAAVCQLYSTPTGTPWAVPAAPDGPFHQLGPAPFRVEPLPSRIMATEVHARAATPGFNAVPGILRPGAVAGEVLIGVGGDELSPVSLRLPARAVLAVVGTPGSGKTNTLRALQALNPARNWLFPGTGDAGGTAWSDVLAMARGGGLPADTVLLADDADQMPPSTVQDVTELHARGFALVLTATYSPALLQRVPLAMAARAGGTAVLLCPRSVADGDIFGARVEVEPGAPPGRAVLVAEGQARPFQVGLVPQPS